MKYSIVIFCILIFFTDGYAQSYTGGGGPNAFYQVPMSPREVAMGGTGVASALGAFAPYWNPSRAIASLEQPDSSRFLFALTSQLGVPTYSNLSDYRMKSCRTEFGFVASLGDIHPLSASLHYLFNLDWLDGLTTKTIMGLSWIGRDVPDVHNTILEYDEISDRGIFTASDGALMLTLAFKDFLIRDIDFGINLRGSYSNYLDDRQQYNILSGTDFGISFPIIKRWQGGTMIRMQKDQRNRELIYCFGLCGKLYTDNLSNSSILSVDISARTFAPLTFSVGVEVPYSFRDTTSFFGDTTFLYRYITILGRAGLKFGRNSNPDKCDIFGNSFCLGLGINYKKYLTVNFSYQFYFHNDDGQYLSLVDPPWKLGFEFAL